MMPLSDSPSGPAVDPAPTARHGWMAAIAVAAVVFLYFGVWAMLRPPLQTPDEPQHLLKANAILLQPWRSAPGRFDLDPRLVNPLALDTPEAIDKLFFSSFNAMTSDDIAVAQAIGWPARSGEARRVPYARAIASYPSLYYLAVHALAEPAVAAFGLTPWQATYAYRLATAAMAAALWALVWLALARTTETAALAAPLVGLTLANPMLAFISSGVTPDAVNNPLCNLGLVLAWRAATRGTDRVALFATCLIAALTKPSGLQLAGLVAAVLALLIVLRTLDWRRGAIAIALVAGAAAASVATFYYGTPPQFMAGGPSHDTLAEYLTTRMKDAGFAWQMYWGRLGWLDYGLPQPWYLAVLALAGLNAVVALVRPRRPARFAGFAALVWLAFTFVTFAGEYHYLDVAGYTFQGRYLLPVASAFAVVLWHDRVWLRRALIGVVAVVNLLLADATISRYYADRWTGLWRALPVHNPAAQPHPGDQP
jgi:Predicted membrane protein (DUF2142)